MSVAFTTSPRRIARSRVSRRKPSRRDQSPMYGEGGHCACIPASRSTARATGRRRRPRRSCRASVARFSSRSVSVCTRPTLSAVTVVVRMAPSPTGFLHIGGVRTFLFNWLFARQQSGENRLRIENTDTSREVAEATNHIQESLRWLGIDWDGPVTFQLDRMDDCRRVADELVAGGKAYEDEGAIRFRMPDEGVTAWDDVVRGRVEVANETIEDLVLVRSDGRPTYNFASPMEDVWDGITHVIRGEDHIS